MKGNILTKKIITSIIFLIGLFVAVSVTFSENILSAIITNLVKSDTIKKADLIVALGGENFRKKEAVRLFKEGYSKKIMFTGFDIERQDYLKYGLKDSDYIYPVKFVFNTYEEAEFTKEVVKKYNFKSVIVVTAFYHTRRSAYIFKKLLEKEGVNVIIHPVFNKSFDIKKWWQNRYLFKVVIIEWLGLMYYHLEY